MAAGCASLLLEVAEQRRVADALHALACQELAFTRERQQHEHEYRSQEDGQALADLRRELSDASLQNEQLKLEVLRWRKQASLLRLKLASTKESVTLQEQNAQLLSEREQRMHAELAALAEQLQQANAHVMRVTAAKAQAQAECAKYQSAALQADMALTQQAEEMKLLGGRCSTTASQLVDLQALNASLQERLTALQAVNASLQGQLDRCQGRDAEAAYAHARLQASLGQLQSELASSRERLREQEVARTAAEAAAAKATAAAEAAADALAAKQQQLDEWRAIDHAAKQLASQQLQMSQAQLEGAREKATVNETKLLDQIAALQQQLAAARVPREPADAVSKVAHTAAVATLEEQVAGMRKEVSKLKHELKAAEARASSEADKAAALQRDLEQQQEMAMAAALQRVDAITDSLPEGTGEGSKEAGSGRNAAGARAAAAAKPRGGGNSRAGKPRRAAQLAAAAAAATAAEELSDGSGSDEGDAFQPAAAASRQHRAAGSGKGRSKPARAAAPRAEAEQQQQQQQEQQQEEEEEEDDLAMPGPDTAVPPPPQANTRPVLQPVSAANRPQQPLPAASQPGKQSSVHVPAGGKAVGSQPGPPPLSFQPQSVANPAAMLQEPGTLAAMKSQSVANLLKKIGTGPAGSRSDKPGGRKRKAGTQGEQVPYSLLASSIRAPPLRK